MQAIINNPQKSHICFLLEASDLENPADVEIMLASRFLDFPYTITEEAKRGGVEILSEVLADTNLAHFILWDENRQKVIGRCNVKNLNSSSPDAPEMTEAFTHADVRGTHAIDTMYAGIFLFLKNQEFSEVVTSIEKCNGSSFIAAIRNGFSFYSPVDRRSDNGYYHLKRGVCNFQPEATMIMQPP